MKVAAKSISIADRLAELSDLIRLRLLRLLEKEQLSVGECAKVLQLPQSTSSRHLKTLAEGGWLQRQSVGTATFYRVSLDDLAPELRALWAATRDALAGSREFEEDDRRLQVVLAERAEDSLSYFGRLAGEWDAVRQTLFGSTFTSEALHSLIPPRWHVADLGCGTGNAVVHLAPVVERVIGVDQSPPMLKAAQKRLRGHRNVEWREGELDELPLGDGEVDAVSCFLVLHHLPEIDPALSEMRRVLRTERGGGVALIVDMYAHDRSEYRQSMGHQHLGFGEEELAGRLKVAGFDAVRFRPVRSAPGSEGPGLFAAVATVKGSAFG